MIASVDRSNPNCLIAFGLARWDLQNVVLSHLAGRRSETVIGGDLASNHRPGSGERPGVVAELDVHLVLDSLSSHKTPLMHRWLLLHRRFKLHLTSTYGSWMNLVERWFSALTTKKLQRSAHKNVAELAAATEPESTSGTTPRNRSSGTEPPTKSPTNSPATAPPSPKTRNPPNRRSRRY